MSRLKKILVAYDGSPHSKEALHWAINLSLLSGAKVSAAKVFDGSQVYPVAEAGGMRFAEALAEMRQEDERLLDEAAAIGRHRGVEVTGELLQGDIAGEILSHAQKNNYDLIIAGTKGDGVLEELLLGSVARNLVSLSRVPVMVVKK